ncbi:MAG: IclR family transcriptional regulator [Candidatus Micrarchaeaceae archaeon]
MEKNKKQIKSILKAFEILNLFESNANMSLSEISEKIKAPKTTTHGLLSTLTAMGFVEKDTMPGRYKLGYKLYELGMAVAKQWQILNVAVPYLKSIVDKLNETTHLAVLKDGEVLYIAKWESTRSIKIVSEVGSKLPAHCTGVGKILLSGLDEKALDYIISSKELKRFTKNTITDPEKLKEEIKKIKEVRYAVDNEEIMSGLKCIAVPIYNHTGSISYALSVSAPAYRLSGDNFFKALNTIQNIALAISKELGYSLENAKEVLYGNT